MSEPDRFALTRLLLCNLIEASVRYNELLAEETGRLSFIERGVYSGASQNLNVLEQPRVKAARAHLFDLIEANKP